MKKLLILILPLMFVLLVWMIFFWTPEKNQSALPTPQIPVGGDFTLQSANGKVSLKDLRDKVVLLYFGYTWCPDICPTNLSMISSALSQLDEKEADQVQAFFISVDPDRDTVERLASYTKFFHQNIIGLTGTSEQLKELGKRYGVSYRMVKQDSATNYVVDHSAETYVINKQGKLQEKLPHAAPPEQILSAIRKNFN